MDMFQDSYAFDGDHNSFNLMREKLGGKKLRWHTLYMRHYREQRVYTKVNGKYSSMPAPGKRPMPKACELCGRPLKVGYHHWDKDNLSKGLWLCYPCHMFAEGVDAGLVGKYFIIKTTVEKKFRVLREAGSVPTA